MIYAKVHLSNFRKKSAFSESELHSRRVRGSELVLHDVSQGGKGDADIERLKKVDIVSIASHRFDPVVGHSKMPHSKTFSGDKILTDVTFTHLLPEVNVRGPQELFVEMDELKVFNKKQKSN